MRKYRTKELTKKKRKLLYWKLFFSFLFFITILFLLSWFSKIDLLKIKEIKIEGNNSIKSELIKGNVENNFSGNFFGLFSKKNILIYPKNTIKKNLLNFSPKIKKISLNVNFDKILTIKIEERKFHSLWCNIENTEEVECYLIDKDGYIYAKSTTKDRNGFKYYLKLDKPFLRKNILDIDKFKELDSLILFMQGLELNPEKIVEGDGIYKVYLSSGTKIILDKKRDYKKMINNLETILDTNILNIEEIENIDYLDLRFDNKIFYK